MRRLTVTLILAACAAFAAPVHAGDFERACAGLDGRLAGPCRGVEVLAAEPAALCRYAGLLPEAACATPLAPKVTRAAIDAYERSWLHRTLAFQYRLGSRLPLRNASWVGTHNSFNSATETPTLSGVDANQQLSLTDQLRLDVRSLELDVHFIPSVWAGGASAPVVCHGRGADELHAGCTTERLLADRLVEIRGWLDAHPDQVLLLYLEDHLVDRTGYDAGAKMLADGLGSRLYKPPPGGAGCAPMPLGLTRRALLRTGAQVLAISGCGVGTAWPGLVWDDAERARYESGPDAFATYPDCDATRSAAVYQAHFVRFYEDSTALSAGVNSLGGGPPAAGLTPEKTAAMTRCGVDLFGFDQLLPDDGRLAALAWSWAPGQPRAGSGACALQGPSGRWRVASCRGRRAFACRAADGTFALDTRRARWSAGRARCRGMHFGVPRTGLEAQWLRAAMVAAGVKTAWLRLRA